MDEKLLLRATEAARLTSFSKQMLYLLAARGAIPVVRVGRAIRFPYQALKDWVRQHQSGGSLTDLDV